MEREVTKLTTNELMLARAVDFRRRAEKVRKNGYTREADWLDLRAKLIEEEYSPTEG